MKYYALVKIIVDVTLFNSGNEIEVLSVSSDKKKLLKVLELEIKEREQKYDFRHICIRSDKKSREEEMHWLRDDEETYHLLKYEIVEITGYKNENVAEVFCK